MVSKFCVRHPYQEQEVLSGVPDCRECRRGRQRKHLLKRYGMTVEDKEALWKKQRGKCAICSKPIAVWGTRECGGSVIDHDHNTGFVRGLLCHDCNVGLGAFGDNRYRLRVALDYLDASEVAQCTPEDKEPEREEWYAAQRG